jgi:hypothetical protein
MALVKKFQKKVLRHGREQIASAVAVHDHRKQVHLHKSPLLGPVGNYYHRNAANWLAARI